MKISVVVPVFNVQDYIEECLESIANQTYNNYEVIIINDGSTDLSIVRAQKFVKLYSNFYIYEFENAGLSTARNRGVERSSGDVIFFMDSDDKIKPDAFQKCVDAFIISKADVVFFDAESFYDQSTIKIKGEYNYERSISVGSYKSFDFFNKSILNGLYIVSACCYMYRRESYKELRFTPGILHEDNEFTTNLLLLNNNLVYILVDKLFLRRVRTGSITTIDKTKAHFDGYLYCFHSIEKFSNIDYIKHALSIYRTSLLSLASFNLFFAKDIRFSYKFSMFCCIYSKILSFRPKFKDVKTFFRLFFPFIWGAKKILRNYGG